MLRWLWEGDTDWCQTHSWVQTHIIITLFVGLDKMGSVYGGTQNVEYRITLLGTTKPWHLTKLHYNQSRVLTETMYTTTLMVTRFWVEFLKTIRFQSLCSVLDVMGNAENPQVWLMPQTLWHIPHHRMRPSFLMAVLTLLVEWAPHFMNSSFYWLGKHRLKPGFKTNILPMKGDNSYHLLCVVSTFKLAKIWWLVKLKRNISFLKHRIQIFNGWWQWANKVDSSGNGWVLDSE